MLIPLVLLSIGAVFSGYLFKGLLIGENSFEFWNNSILFLKPLINNHPPFWLLIITPIIVINAIPITYYFFIKDKRILKHFVSKNQSLYNFLLNKWYFDEIYNIIFVEPIKKIGLFFWKSGDVKTIDRFGPDGFSNIIKFLSVKAVKFQSGYIYQYAFTMLIGLSLLLTYFIFY